MAIQPTKNLIQLMDSIFNTLQLIDKQNVKPPTSSVTSAPDVQRTAVDEEIQKVSSAIFSLEKEIESLKQELTSSSDFIKKHDLAKENDIQRWKFLNARFAIGCGRHQHRYDKIIPTNSSFGYKEDGFYRAHSDKWHHLLFAGCSTNDEVNEINLGWEFDPKLKRHVKNERYLK